MGSYTNSRRLDAQRMGAYIEKHLKEFLDDIVEDIEMNTAAKIAQMMAVTLEQGMKNAGIRRSEDTGTHLGRSESEKKGYRKQGGSILDQVWKVKSYEDEVMAFAGTKTSKEYRARFRNDGISNHYLWSYKKERSLGEVEGVHYRKNAEKVIKAEIPSMVAKNIRKVKRKYKSKSYRINLSGKRRSR